MIKLYNWISASCVLQRAYILWRKVKIGIEVSDALFVEA